MDKLGLMKSFVVVVEQGSYTKAAKHLGKTKAIVSRQVSQLEEHLQIRLINRTTRSISITDEGRKIYQRCCHIFDEVSILESTSLENDDIAGRIRICAPQSFGELQLIDQLSSFMTKYPNLTIELKLSDHYVNLIDEGFDIGLRIGQMEDSNLIARKISQVSSLLVASPEFLSRYVTQHNKSINSPADLNNTPCIYDSNRRSGTKWQFKKGEQDHTIKITPRLTVNSAVASCKAAIDGLGVALLPNFSVQAALNKKQLVSLLPEFETPEIGIYAIYPHKQHLTTKVKKLLDYLLSYQNSNNV
jgi:DNA-binding transcriptional LysR family regulator